MLPQVSVIMLVYNGEYYIKEAIKSILNQTFRDFELLIINDGSTDNSIAIISKFGDSRIRIIHNDGNKGLVYSRNRGVSEANGEFIAIMDCDDISHQTRLEKQLNFLKKNPEFAVVGSLVQSINENGKPIGKQWELYAPPEKIPAIMLFRNYIPNPSAMIRKSMIKEFCYEAEFPPAEDYALWLKIIEKHKVWVYPEILLYYRVHDSNISRIKISQKLEAERKLLRKQLEQFLPEFSNDELDIHHSLYIDGVNYSKEQINQVIAWLKKLEETNKIVNKYPQQYFMEVLADEFYIACKGHSTHLGFWIILKFYSNSSFEYLNLGFMKHARFIGKAVIQQFQLFK